VRAVGQFATAHWVRKAPLQQLDCQWSAVWSMRSNTE